MMMRMQMTDPRWHLAYVYAMSECGMDRGLRMEFQPSRGIVWVRVCFFSPHSHDWECKSCDPVIEQRLLGILFLPLLNRQLHDCAIAQCCCCAIPAG